MSSTISSLKPIVDRFPRVAALYRNVRDQLAFDTDPIKTKWGFTLVGSRVMASGEYEPTITAHIRRLLKDVDVFVNVGANIGYYCCHALSMGKTVIAFEPIPKNHKYLCLNIMNNGWQGVEVYPIALSSKVGVTKIYGSNTSASLVKGWAGVPEHYVNYVPTSTLDVILGERLHGKRVLALVDVEGAEKRLLEGAGQLLASEPRPIWIVEITTNENVPRGVDSNPDYAATFDLFFQKKYKAHALDQTPTPFTKKDIALVVEGEREASTHNYLFRGSS